MIVAAWTRWASGPGAVASPVWAVGVLLYILLSALLPQSMLGDPLLPSWVPLTLLCTEATLLGLLAGAAMAASSGLRRLSEKVRNPFARRAIEAVRMISAALLLLLLAGSCAVCWAVGRYVDLEGVKFLSANFSPLVGFARAMNPWLLGIVPVVAIAAGLAGARWLPSWVARWPQRFRSAVVRISAVLFAFSLVVSLLGQIGHRYADSIVDDPITGAPYPVRNVFRVRRDQRTGPVTSIVFTLFTGERDRLPQEPAAGGSETVERPPIQTREQYQASVDPSRRREWNVVIVVIDSVRPDCLEAYGRRPSIAPVIDALAKESVVYADCYSTASHTSLAAMCPLTGQYPLRGLGLWEYPERPTYPRVLIYDVLHGLGYRTAVFSSQNEHWGYMSRHLVVPGLDRFFHAPVAAGGTDPGPQRTAIDDEVANHAIDDRITIDAAMAWIDGGTKPYCLAVNLQAPHFPYALPEGVRKAGARKPPSMGFGNVPRDRIPEIREMYEECVTYADAQVGRLIDRIKSRGDWDRTVFVVTADHGQAFYEHGFATHGSRLYDEVMKVPLLLRAPGLKPAADARPAILIDIPPTVLDLLGLPPHSGFQGDNLLQPAARDGRSRFLVSATTLARQVGIVRDGFKLIRDLEYGVDLLYDLKADPSERHDLRDRRSGVARDLGWKLDGWVRQQLDYYGNRERHTREFPPRFRP